LQFCYQTQKPACVARSVQLRTHSFVKGTILLPRHVSLQETFPCIHRVLVDTIITAPLLFSVLMVFRTLNERPQNHDPCPFQFVDVDVQKTPGDGKLFGAGSNAACWADQQTDPFFPVAVNESTRIFFLDPPQFICVAEWH